MKRVATPSRLADFDVVYAAILWALASVASRFLDEAAAPQEWGAVLSGARPVC